MKRKKLAFFMALALMLTLLTACGGSGGSRSYANADMAMEAAEMPMWDMDEDDSYYYGADTNYRSAKMTATPSASAGAVMGPTPEPSANAEARPQKLIRTAELSMETTAFEETAAALADLTERLGGYFADSNAGERGQSVRWANYTIRIPVNNFQTFLDQISGLCHETRRHVSQQDISERYYDTAGRLRTQNIKLQRLQVLLEKAQNMEDIITIQSAISETEQMIDDLSGTLRHYDNQVDYSTITLSLEEVYRFSNVPETPKSYGSLLVSAFVDGLRDFAEWLEDITVSLAYSWPWLALIALIAYVIVKVNRKRREQRRQGAAPQRQTAPHGVHIPHIGLGLKKTETPSKDTGNPSNGPENAGNPSNETQNAGNPSKESGNPSDGAATGESDAPNHKEE